MQKYVYMQNVCDRSPPPVIRVAHFPPSTWDCPPPPTKQRSKYDIHGEVAEMAMIGSRRPGLEKRDNQRLNASPQKAPLLRIMIFVL